jgi:hypothetical protein
MISLAPARNLCQSDIEFQISDFRIKDYQGMILLAASKHFMPCKIPRLSGHFSENQVFEVTFRRA